MKFIADLHIHSHFSVATSKKLIPEYLDYWARIKGIDVIGTGDCIHPGWLDELREKLEDAGNGFYRLKDEYRIIEPLISQNPNLPKEIFFILTGELSSIYKKQDKVRKVHNLCVFPDFDSVLKVQKKLDEIGNIRSDGRPILGLDSKILLDMVLESNEKSFLVPAHIWTPWFSVLGSKSGFDSIDECYEDLTHHIFAVETGLSSDPPMNWSCSFLDRFALVSNSDAHSPEKLGREANLFNTELSYNGIYDALSNKLDQAGRAGFLGTIEFFPQEGKYHYDGHRKCNICWDPLETLENSGICPECGKPVTRGVMYRVAELADRSDLAGISNQQEFYSITSLPDILSEVLGKQPKTKTVQQEYMRLIKNLGSEFHILLHAGPDEIKEHAGEILARGIEKLRKGDVFIEEGYDGEFGRIKIFNDKNASSYTQASLFSEDADHGPGSLQGDRAGDLSVKFNINKFQSLLTKSDNKKEQHRPLPLKSTDEQKAGIEHFKGPCMVIAGPGAGKTRILTQRIIHLITTKAIDPKNILAVTFSNKASGEIRDRVKKVLPSLDVKISTFHSFGLSVLKEHHEEFGRTAQFNIVSNKEKEDIIKELVSDKRGLKRKLTMIEAVKQGIIPNDIQGLLKKYETELKNLDAFDLADLIYLPVRLFKDRPEILSGYRDRYQWILVDEYQDINARQYEMIRLLGGDNPNLFVIGDPDQAIYGFRGSDIRFIEKLKKDLPGIREINLTKSYRCPGSILKVAGQVLQKKEYLKGNPGQRKIHIQENTTDKSEADWIASQIEGMMGGVRSFSMDSGISDGDVSTDIKSFSDFAVLCRSSVMFKPITKALEDHGIAYQVIDTEPFYEKEPVRKLLSDFKNIYLSIKNKKPLPQHFGIQEIRRLIIKKEDIFSILSILMKDTAISSTQKENLKKLADTYENRYHEFLHAISMRRGVDDFDEKSETVSLMTLHASKGLEFNAVFIAGCEQDILPFELFGNKSKQELDEEERLFYVGITRTLKYLFLSFAKRRQFRGRSLSLKRSPYIDRIEKDLALYEKRKERIAIPEEIQLDLF